MLDWAIAEVQSPSWRGRFHDLEERLVRKLSAGDKSVLSAEDRANLIKAIIRFRGKYLIFANGISASSTYWSDCVNVHEMKEFSVIPFFTHRYGDVTFGELAERIRSDPLAAEVGMRESVASMLQRVRNGEVLNGKPVAVVRVGAPPILIEGYKRGMAALWSGASVVRLFFCAP